MPILSRRGPHTKRSSHALGISLAAATAVFVRVYVYVRRAAPAIARQRLPLSYPSPHEGIHHTVNEEERGERAKQRLN